MSKRIGLPVTLKMRHDAHYVEQLTSFSGAAIGRMIPVDKIRPNPDQPRKVLGDLRELTDSIRDKGVLEPLLVRFVPRDDCYHIISGERRYHASRAAGLREVPCIEKIADDAETLELALIENLQRKDLSAFEEADGLKTLAESYGYTHEKMAERLGKSRTSITETLSLATMPEEVRERCRRADIHAKSLLLQIVRQSETEKMIAMLERMQREGTPTRHDARRIARESKKTRGRPRRYVFRHQPRDKSFTLTLHFKRSVVERDELVNALLQTLDDLRART